MKLDTQKKIRWWFILLTLLEVPFFLICGIALVNILTALTEAGVEETCHYPELCTNIFAAFLLIFWFIFAITTYILAALDKKWAACINVALLAVAVYQVWRVFFAYSY